MWKCTSGLDLQRHRFGSHVGRKMKMSSVGEVAELTDGAEAGIGLTHMRAGLASRAAVLCLCHPNQDERLDTSIWLYFALLFTCSLQINAPALIGAALLPRFSMPLLVLSGILRRARAVASRPSWSRPRARQRNDAWCSSHVCTSAGS